MKHFVTVLTDTCEVENIHYVIHTSIHILTYKVEVFQDAIRIDATEITCNVLKHTQHNEQLFIEEYQDAHRKMRDKFCTKIEKNIHIPKPDNSIKNDSETKNITNYNIPFKKIIIVSILLIGTLWAIYTYVFIYSDIYLNTFDTNEEKILYLEEIESHSNILEESCIKLSKKQLRKYEDIITVKNCKSWCQKNIIDTSKCGLLLAYFKVNYTDINLSTVSYQKHIEKKVLDYKVLPQSNLIALHKTQHFDLMIHNRSEHAILVKLKDLILDHHENEEIVQFQQSITELLLKSDDKKTFSIFLEPSYYTQFDSGKYTGKLRFEVSYKQTKETFIQAFFFMVK